MNNNTPNILAKNAVEEAIVSRRSIRRFLPTPVSQDVVAHLLDVAARAPSGTNMQPWRVHVLTGAVKNDVANAVHAAHQAGAEDAHSGEYKYYPETFFEPYLSRRRKVGWDLYNALGIEKRDTAAMRAQHGRNFLFFDAPVGIICTIDRRLEIGSWLDYGMFLQNIMVAARGVGLDTCCQAAFSITHKILRKHIPLEDNEIVVCGISLGVADPNAPENALVTEREPAGQFSTFAGF